jgi:hypothetical protein
MSLNRLPDELIVKIFSYFIDKRNYTILQSTCKRFYTIIDIYFRHLKLTRPVDVCHVRRDYQKFWMVSKLKYVKCISLKIDYPSMLDVDDDACLNLIRYYKSNLDPIKELTVSLDEGASSFERINFVLTLLNNVKRLIIKWCIADGSCIPKGKLIDRRFDYIEFTDLPYQKRPMMETVMDTPATELRINQTSQQYRGLVAFLRRYLSKHRMSVENLTLTGSRQHINHISQFHSELSAHGYEVSMEELIKINQWYTRRYNTGQYYDYVMTAAKRQAIRTKMLETSQYVEVKCYESSRTGFDCLPDELVMRIFSYLENGRCDFKRLRETCTRFCSIINKLTAHRPPVFKVTYRDSCCLTFWCIANFRFAKCRHLRIHKVCKNCLEFIKYRKSDLKTLIELTCLYLSDSLDSLLVELDNIKRLNIDLQNDRDYHPWQQITGPPINRTVDECGFWFLANSPLNDIILSRISASEIEIRFFTDSNEDDFNEFRTWIERYLTQHQETVKKCFVRVSFEHRSALIDISGRFGPLVSIDHRSLPRREKRTVVYEDYGFGKKPQRPALSGNVVWCREPRHAHRAIRPLACSRSDFSNVHTARGDDKKG